MLPGNAKRLEKDLANKALKDKLGNEGAGDERGATGGTEEEEMEDAGKVWLGKAGKRQNEREGVVIC